MKITRLIRMSGKVFALVLFSSAFAQPAYAHAGEAGFHADELWSLLRTVLMVALVIAGLIGGLWLYRRVKPQQK